MHETHARTAAIGCNQHGCTHCQALQMGPFASSSSLFAQCPMPKEKGEIIHVEDEDS